MLKMLALGSVVSCWSVALLWTPNAIAQEPTLKQLRTCAAIENPLKRLVCYDKVAAGEGVDIAETQSQATTTPERSRPKQASPEDSFGLPKDADDGSDILYVALSKAEKDPYGKWIIYFTNGQVWKQTDSQTFPLPLDGDYAIERGLMNGYFFGQDGLNKRIKVRRIK